MTKLPAGLFACVAFIALVMLGVAANAATASLPKGFTVPADFREDAARRQYFDFDTAPIDSTHMPEGHLWRIATSAVVPNNNGDVIVALFATDLEKDGWTILRRQGALVAHKTSTPELWLNGTGNSGYFSLVLIEVAPPSISLTLKQPQAQVETVSDTQDLPYLLPLPGSKMEKTIKDQHNIEIKLPNATQTTLAVSNATRWYDEPAGISSYEFATVYKAALTAAGWDITKTQVGGDVAITAHFGQNGRDIWIYTHGDGSKQSINVVDYGADTATSALKQQLDKDGQVALYGIYFDTDSSVPRPESEATLQNVLQMLKANPTLRLEVQGHTDSTGATDHNLTLSDARAASVVQWLVGHGIAAANLTSKGYGATMPVADNKTDDGRAKNRRVELVKIAAAAPAAPVVPPPAGTSVAASTPPATAAKGPLVTLPKGTVLNCTLAPAKGADQSFSVANSSGKPLPTETIINTVVNWKSATFPVGEKDDCFALDVPLSANGTLTRTNTLPDGAVALTCQAYVSAAIPSVVHSTQGGAASTTTACDPPP